MCVVLITASAGVVFPPFSFFSISATPCSVSISTLQSKLRNIYRALVTMSRKKVVVQEELETEEEWATFMAKPGLKGAFVPTSTHPTALLLVHCNCECSGFWWINRLSRVGWGWRMFEVCALTPYWMCFELWKSVVVPAGRGPFALSCWRWPTPHHPFAARWR
jgi:hypothetical protein